MPKTLKDGSTEVRAFTIIQQGREVEPMRRKGWKRIEMKKLAPRVAYELLSGIHELAGQELRLYMLRIVELPKDEPAELLRSLTSSDLTKVSDALTEWRHMLKGK